MCILGPQLINLEREYISFGDLILEPYLYHYESMEIKMEKMIKF